MIPATTEKPLDIRQYLEIGLRRKWYIIIPVVLSMVISYGVYKRLPKIYKATTLILVQSQRVPQDYVRSTITDSVAARLTTISQEILSRTRLEKVIQEFNLFSEFQNKKPMEEIVEIMRKAVEVKVQDARSERGQHSFTISYEGKEPSTVMVVTNKLASLFIEENLKVRESQAESTYEFLSKELLTMEDQLKKKEESVLKFKGRNMGQLPQQLDANLRILERLNQQLQTTSENLRAAEERGMLIQNRIDYLKKPESLLMTKGRGKNLATGSEDTDSEQLTGNPLITQLNNLKRDLSNALSRYTENHPDVIDLKKKIDKLEANIKARQEGLTEDSSTSPVLDPAMRGVLAKYTDQYNEILLEIRRLKEEGKKLKEQIVLYQKRIEDTPQLEQELTLLTRDYDLLKSNYQSLLDKKIQAQLAGNLERKQQGEQFKILDPARVPVKPIRPDPMRIFLIGTFMGLAAGLGLIWFRESLDQSFHSFQEVEVYLGIPVIATIPGLKEERQSKRAA